MTCNTSAVAVCCSSASRCSLNSRAFSIAITACAAKLSNNAISMSENGRTSCRNALMKPSRAPSFRSGTMSMARNCVRLDEDARNVCISADVVRPHIRDVDKPFAADQRPMIIVRAQRTTHRCSVLFGIALCRHCAEILAVVGHQGTHRGAAEPVRLFQDRLEHRPRIARRAVDDFQHLGQRGLPCQRRVALGTIFVELLLQRRVGAL